MLKLKIKWEMEDESKFEEWTRPIELAWAERELYNGKSIVAILQEEHSASNNLLLFLAHKIHTRLSDKPVGNFDQWSKKVITLEMPDFEAGKVTSQEV
jgi:hypothetical protein